MNIYAHTHAEANAQRQTEYGIVKYTGDGNIEDNASERDGAKEREKK